MAETANLSSLLAHAAERHGGRDALVESGTVLDYRGMFSHALRCAGALRARGIQPGDRVAILLPNGWHYAVSYFGAQLAGSIAVLVNARLSAPEIAHVLADSGASLVITDDTFAERLPEGFGVQELFRLSMDEILKRLDDPVVMMRLVVGLVHPFLVLAGAAAIAALRLARAAAAALTGLAFFVMWATIEAVQQAINLVAVHAAWRITLASTTDAATVARLRASIESYAPVSDALFLAILIAFGAASLAFAAAMWSTDRLARAVAIGFVLAAGLGVISGITSFGGDVLPPSVMAVLYPLLQPPARFLTGIWIWRQTVAGTRLDT